MIAAGGTYTEGLDDDVAAVDLMVDLGEPAEDDGDPGRCLAPEGDPVNAG